MHTKQQQQYHNQSGFVILFSILISTIILIMSAGIFNIAQKETILSSYSRESQKAFYAADSGVECALYWDVGPITQTRFPRSQENGTNTPSFNCGVDGDGDSQSITAYKYDVVYDNGLYDHVFGFRYPGSVDGDACSFVLVEKKDPEPPTTPDGPQNPASVRITAVGYNICDEEGIPDLGDPTLLERRLSVRYRNL